MIIMNEELMKLLKERKNKTKTVKIGELKVKLNYPKNQDLAKYKKESNTLNIAINQKELKKVISDNQGASEEEIAKKLELSNIIDKVDMDPSEAIVQRNMANLNLVKSTTSIEADLVEFLSEEELQVLVDNILNF